MEFREGAALVHVRRGLVEHRQFGDRIQALVVVVDVARAELILVAHVEIHGDYRVVRVGVVRRVEQQGAERYGDAGHDCRAVRDRRGRHILLEDAQIGGVESRDAGQRRVAGGGRRVHLTGWDRRSAQRVVLEIAEIEKLVLDDGPAHRRAEAIVIVARLAGQPGYALLLVQSVEVAILQVFVDRTVNRVRARLHDQVEYAARRAAELRAELVLKQRELLHRIVRNGDLRAGDIVVVVHHAVYAEGVILRTLSGNAGARALSDTAGTGHAGAEQAEVPDSGAASRDTQVLRRVRGKGGLQLRGRGVDQRRRGGNLHSRRDRAYLQRQVDRSGVVEIQRDIGHFGRREAVGGGRNVVLSDWKVVDPVFSGRVGRCGVLDAGGYIKGNDRRVRYRCSAGVRHAPDEIAVDRLRVQHRRREQARSHEQEQPGPKKANSHCCLHFSPFPVFRTRLAAWLAVWPDFTYYLDSATIDSSGLPSLTKIRFP